jgi:hypothetical protein
LKERERKSIEKRGKKREASRVPAKTRKSIF